MMMSDVLAKVDGFVLILYWSSFISNGLLYERTGQQQSFRPFGLSATQRPYLPESLRELDSHRRKTDALASIHPSLGFATINNHLGINLCLALVFDYFPLQLH